MAKNKQKGKKQPPQKMDYESIRARDRMRKAAKKEKTKAKRRKAWCIAGVSTAAAIVLVAGGIIGARCYRQSSGIKHKKIIVESAHYTVSAAMMQYYYQDCMDQYTIYQAEHSDEPMFDSTKPLRSQEYQDGTTWFQLFFDSGKRAVSSALQYCEAATEAGIQLTQEQLDQCRAKADETDLSHYPKGLTKDDVFEVQKINLLSETYRIEAIRNISITDEEIKTYYDENEQSLQTVTVLGYAFPFDAQAAMSGDDSGRQEAVSRAEALAASKTEAEFCEGVRKYLTDEESVDPEEARRIAENLQITDTVGSFTEDGVQDWLLTAKVNETAVFAAENQSYTLAFMLLSAPERDDSPTADLRIIFLPASSYEDDIDKAVAQGQTLMDDCIAQDRSADVFAQMASEYNEDSQSGSGGLHTGLAQSCTTYGTELTDWAFASDRKPGDMLLFNRSTAAVLAYYEGENTRKAWQSSVYDTVYAQIVTELRNNVNGQPVTIHDENATYLSES